MYIFDAAYQSLYKELVKYEEAGIAMLMDGCRVTSMEVVKAHMTREQGKYMRDYNIAPEGHIEALAFHPVIQ